MRIYQQTRSIVRFIGLLAVLIALGSCNNPFSPVGSNAGSNRTSGGNGSTGRLELSLGGSFVGVQTVLPGPVTPDSYSVTMMRAGFDDVLLTGITTTTVSIPDLAIGEWDIEVTAFIADTAVMRSIPGLVVTIILGVNNINVELLPLTEGSGAVSVTINWPMGLIDGYLDGESSIADLAGGPPQPLGVSGAVALGANSLLYSADLGAGFYQLRITLIRGGVVVARIFEVVHVYDTLTSSKTITLTAEQISNPPAAPSGVAVTQPQLSEVIVSWTDESNTEEGFQIHRNGTPIGTVAAGVTTFSDALFTGGETYTYEVRAFNSFGESPVAASIAVVPMSDVGLEGPAPAAIGQPLRLNFWWDPGFGAQEIELNVLQAGVPVVTQVVPDPQVGGYELTIAQALARDTTYEWYLVARNPNLEIQTPVQTFTTRGATLYVDGTAGIDNTQRGANTGAPVRTIQYAIETLGLPGDTIHVTAGTYDATLPQLSQPMNIIGSYVDTSYTGRSIAPPTTVIAPAVGGADTSAVTINSVAVTLDGLILRPAAGTGNTYGVNVFGASDVLLENTRIEIDPLTVASIQIRGISLGGSGTLTMRTGAIELGGRVWNGTAHQSAYGIWIFNNYNGSVEFDTVDFGVSGNPDATTSGIIRARSLRHIEVQNVTTGNRNILVSNSTFSGAVTGEDGNFAGDTTAALNIGNSSDVVLRVFDSRFEEMEVTQAGTQSIFAVNVATAASEVEVQRSIIFDITSNLNSGNLHGVRVNGVPTVTVNSNKFRVRARATSGSAYGVNIDGAPGGAQLRLSNNVIELTGAAGGLASYAVRTLAATDIFNNTVVYGNDYTNGAASNAMFLGTGANGSRVYNNIIANYSGVNYTGIVNNATTAIHTNVFHQTSDNVAGINAGAAASGNLVLDPALMTGGDIGTTNWYAPTGATSALILAGGSDSVLATVPEDISATTRTAGAVSKGAYQVNGQSIFGALGPAGGLIFYANNAHEADGWRFLEVVPAELGVEYSWSNPAFTVNGTLSDIGAGPANTAAIVTVLAANGLNGMAAQIASNYVLGGATDWFLPSLFELQQAYDNLHVSNIGGFLAGAGSFVYWSSTETDATSARGLIFSSGTTTTAGKTIAYRVRPVRRF